VYCPSAIISSDAPPKPHQCLISHAFRAHTRLHVSSHVHTHTQLDLLVNNDNHLLRTCIDGQSLVNISFAMPIIHEPENEPFAPQNSSRCISVHRRLPSKDAFGLVTPPMLVFLSSSQFTPHFLFYWTSLSKPWIGALDS
jgi:hypothetical protein